MPTLKKISWDDALSTGDESLDTQHRVLIDTFNDLADAIEHGATKDSIGKILSVLKFYAGWHFSREEDCMQKYSCPVAEKNQKAHAVFVQNFNNYQKEFYLSEDVADLATRMHTDLSDWIYNHILAVDAKLYFCIHPTK